VKAVMSAAVYDRYGPPEVLRIVDLPMPVPRDDEVLVRVYASPVGAVDSIARRGHPRQIRAYLGLRRPRIHVLGADFAGEVAAVGAKVTRFAVGDQVFGTIAPRFGAHAQYACVSENGALAPKPAGLSHAEAAALVDGTALCFLRDKAKLHAGQSVLINGASGSVGTAAVQHARALGATVTAVCSGANEALVRSLGADEVIDYTKEDFTRTGRTYDVIFDVVGASSFSRCRAALNRGGVYLTAASSLRILLQMAWTRAFGDRRAVVAFTGLRPARDKLADLRYVTELVAAAKMVPVVDRTYPLRQIAEAHRYVDAGHKRGNVVVDATGDD
jgi:NADPH:quinone reductase-like Zn-dependent oxidoreductase